MRLFIAESRVSRKQQTGSLSTSSQSSSHTTPSRPTHSIAWSLLCFVVVLNSFLAFLSPSTAGGRALAAVEAGFCGDCQTFANAIGVCGGKFTPADIEVPTEYVLQKEYATCTCTAVMQQVLWTCAKCEFLAGKGSKGVPPKKHLTACLEWGITLDAYNLPYKGVVAPGTTTDLGNGTPNPPSVPGTTTTSPPLQPTTDPAKPNPSTTSGSGGNDGGDKPSGTTSDSSNPSNSQDSLNGDKNASGTTSGPNTAAIGISVGIIGVAFIAGVMAVVMMKRRRRRRTPLDLDSSPALANFSHLEDNWEAKPNRPTSPPLPPAPVASAAPIVGRGNGRGGYGDGSVVGGYDAQYDSQYDGQYDQYDSYGHGHHGGYDAYGHGQGGHGQGGHGHGGYGGQEYDHYRGGQYNQGGYGEQDAYQMHDYGYDQHVVAASKRPPAHGAPMDHKRP